jgi:hypothetical protein
MKTKKLTTVVSIALTGNRLYAALLRRAGGRTQVVRSMQTSLALDPLNNDPQLVGRELRRHLEEAGIGERRCIVSLPLRWAFVAPVDVPPELAAEDRDSYLELHAERSFPFGLEDLVRSTTWPRPGRATIVAIPLSYLNPLLAALTAAHLKPVAITLGILSLEGAAPGGARREGVDLLVGADGLEMAVRAGDGYAALRTLDDAILRDVDGTRFDGEMISRQMRITLGQLPAEMLGGVRRVTIHGAESLMRPLVEELRPTLAKLDLTLETAWAAEVKGSGLEAAPQVIGAGMRCLQGLSPVVDFLPQRESRWGAARRRIASRRSIWMGAAAALLVLAGGGTYGYQTYQLQRLQARWDAIGGDVKRVEEVEARVAKFRPWFDADAPSLRIWNDVATAFPERGTVWMTSLKITNLTDVVCDGKASDQNQYYRTTDSLMGMDGVRNFNTVKIGNDDRTLLFQFNFNWEPRRTHGS